MNLKFTKMHGLGNDFMMIDLINQAMTLTPELIRSWADRHLGVGFDQLLCIIPARTTGADIGYRIFNADGSEAEQCGNGARCVAKFAHEQGLVKKTQFVAETVTRNIEFSLQDDGLVKVNMGVPVLEPAEIPFQATKAAPSYKVRVFDAEVTLSAVSMGNPHAVLLVDDLSEAPVARLGPLLEKHERFPQGTNVGFLQVLNKRHVGLRVFERGAGETLACGSGACAAVVAAHNLGLVENQVLVSLPGGDLTIEWAGDHAPVWMVGPAITVYTAELLIAS
jgi:diaminopimelate epimerase